MKPNFELIRKTKGFLDEEEGMRLYDLALDASKLGPCLEIGSYCGKSTLFIGAACKKNDTLLFAVDHHRGSEEQQAGEAYFDEDLYDRNSGRIDTFPFFRNTISEGGLEDTVVPLVCKSEPASRYWATPLGLVFIDGGHSFSAVYTDYSSWSGHVAPGGYLVIHDIFKNPSEGGQAPYHIYRLALASRLFKDLPMTKTLGVLRRRRCFDVPESLPV